MKLSSTEAKLLGEALLAWAESKPQSAGVPLMYTDSAGDKCLLTHDEIESLYLRLEHFQHYNNTIAI